MAAEKREAEWLQAGDREDGMTVAARWMDEHWDAMVQAARRYAGSVSATPEDIAQEALWAAYERRDRLVDTTGERAWLLAFVRNKAREALRRSRRRGNRLPEEYADCGVDPNPSDFHDARREQVLEAAAILPEAQEKIVHLILRGCRDDEIAASTGLKKGTAWVYKHRAIRKLKRIVRRRSAGKRNQPEGGARSNATAVRVPSSEAEKPHT